MEAATFSAARPQMRFSVSNHKLSWPRAKSMSVSCHSNGELPNFDKPPSQALGVLSSCSADKSIAISGGLYLLSPAQKRNPAGQTFCAASAAGYTHGENLVESHTDTTEDRDIIRLPRLFRFLQRPLAQLISVLRAPKSKEGYAAIGGGSPLRKITDEQADAIKMALEAKGMPVNVYVGMRYWYPFTEEAIHQARLQIIYQEGQDNKACCAATLPTILHLHNWLKPPCSSEYIQSWYQREGYIKAMADLIRKELEQFTKPEEVMIFFSAHGVPVSYVEDAGDPYKDQMEECIYLIMQELKARGFDNDHTLAYQSRVGPVKWLKPYTDEVLVELGQKGVKSLLAVPVSFVSEHIETLEEIDMEYKHLALESGIENWGRVPALGCTSTFITDLADAVIEALPSAKAIYTSKSTSQEADYDPLSYAIKMFFGSILAFVLLLSPKMILAFRNHVF
ncbi:hypothetical protein GH714_013031 [Hevea brasiliensis]|uniref:Ferrochelatase n=1 Tax=Hevea brasiliensis TaxID=3981 RepID=A0A6A6KCW9_HEVBR|nr:hypothetical protein GH714_013031 [Hevea brasiliensis]